MDEHALIAAGLALLGQVWDTGIELGPDGACTLTFDQGLEVALWHDISNSRLHIDADLLDIHAEHRSGIYKRALILNHTAFETAGVTVALDHTHHQLIARSALSLTALEPDTLAERIADVLLATQALHEKLHIDHDDDSGSTIHPAHHSGFIKA